MKICVNATSENGVKGIVEKVGFWGSFYELEVRIGEFTIILRMVKNEWGIGEEVNVVRS